MKKVQRPRLVTLAVSLLVCGAGGNITYGSNDPYDGSLDRDAPRGIQIVHFKVPGTRPDEICVIPIHLPFAGYTDKDAAEEKLLATYNFHGTGNTGQDGTVAVCPKLKSTSAAVELYEVPAGAAKPAIETPSYCQSIIKSSKCVAKFKQTDDRYTTTNTAAILGYYHVSRVLGGICEITPAVLRTMDIEQHKKVVQMSSSLGAHGIVAKSWGLFPGYYANPAKSPVAQELFTTDFLQIYGALLQNTSGEEDYAEWERSRTDLPAIRAFQNMSDPRSVKTILGSTAFSQSTVQSLVGMRDMSDMILIDYLLAQSDRLSGGNMSDAAFACSIDSGHVKESPIHKGDQGPSNSVTVKKLIIKDTDAGMFPGSNTFRNKGYLSRISHMDPDTYNRLIAFAQKWKEDPTVRDFFHKECTFTTREVALFDGNLSTAASTLQSRHDAGKLILDLDLDDYFSEKPGSSPTPATPK
jgi:hypothetical protein